MNGFAPVKPPSGALVAASGSLDLAINLLIDEAYLDIRTCQSGSMLPLQDLLMVKICMIQHYEAEIGRNGE